MRSALLTWAALTALMLPITTADPAQLAPSAPPPLVQTPPSPGIADSLWTWPVTGPAGERPRVLAAFRPPLQRWLAGHRGVDLDAPTGTRVRAPSAGTVVYAGVVAGRGVLTLDHGAGVLSSYEPISTRLTRGARLARGEVIGRVEGRSHCGAGCLHWGVRVDGTYRDPLTFLGEDSRPSVLLPSPS